MTRRKTWARKPEVDIEDLMFAHPAMLILWAAFVNYSFQNGKIPVITSLFEDPVQGRVSRTHKEGRAFDTSVRGWTDKEINDFVAYFNTEYKSIAAISASDGVPRAAVYHIGTAPHLHIQCHP